MKIQDLTGQKFKQLTVIGFEEIRGIKKYYWRCLCDCGNETVVERCNLKRGTTYSCGCRNKKVRSEKARKNLLNKKFERLLVLDLDRIENNSQIWKCICDCGNLVFASTPKLNSGNTKSCGCYRLDKIHEMSGENHPNWRADLSDNDRKNSKNRNYWLESREWKLEVLKRDNFTCQLSNQKTRNLEIHHLYNWQDYPNQRIEIENGITLFKPIHRLFHKIFGLRKNTPQQFGIFKKIFNNESTQDALQLKIQLTEIDAKIKKIKNQIKQENNDNQH